MIARFCWGTLYGIAFMLITCTMLFSVLTEWPSALLWLKIGAGLAAQFGLGVFAYMQDPESAWKRIPSIGKGGLALLLVLGVTACGPPVIKMPVGAAAIGYAHGVELYTTGKLIAVQLRTEKKISDPQWEELKALDVKATTMRAELEKALLNPTQEVDYEKILAYTAQTAELLMKLGIIVAK
jgi:hypothetical protein